MGIFTWVVLGWAGLGPRRPPLGPPPRGPREHRRFCAVLLVYVALKLTLPGAERFL